MLPRTRGFCCLSLVVVCAFSCGPQPKPANTRSILLITAEGWKSSEFPLGEEMWQGFGIAASGARRPALASVLTGLRPWQHQLLEESTPTISGELPLLSEAMGKAGYRAIASLPAGAMAANRAWRGLDQGFDQILEQATGATDLRGLLRAGASPVFLWHHEVGTAAELAKRIPRIVEAVGSDVWVVAVGVPGPGSADLSREAIEYPLWIRLPKKAGGSPLAIAAGSRVAQTRIWSTLVSAVAGLPMPAHAPSLWLEGSPAILSEAYGASGGHRYSLLSGDFQLYWEVSYAESRSERPRRALLRSRPLRGGRGEAVRTRLFRWVESGAEPVEDPVTMQRLAVLLEKRWRFFSGGEHSPREEARVRNQAHPTGGQESGGTLETR